MGTSRPSASRRLKSPSPGALVFHGLITAALLAIGLGRSESYGPEDPRAIGASLQIERAREDVAGARRALAAVESRFENRSPGVSPNGSEGDRTPVLRVDDLLPATDGPPAELDRFAGRLVDLQRRERRSRLLAYYDTVTRPLLPGYDDAVIARVRQAFSEYAESMQAIPWGRFHLLEDGAEESWRQYLERRDGQLREILARDLPPEKVELLRERFAVRVPAPGEPLPSPRLAGTADGGR